MGENFASVFSVLTGTVFVT